MKVYANEKPERVFKKLLDINLKGKKVLIKPNFAADIHASKGVTTDLKLIKELITFLKKKGARVIVGESAIEKTREVFNKLGVNKLPCKVINFEEDKWVKVKSMTGLSLTELSLPKTALDSDLIISFAKLKTHVLTSVTLSIKNLFGLLNSPDRKKAHIVGLSESLVDILSCFKKGKVIGLIDGVIALDGRLGPINGKPRKVGLIIGSKDLVSCDSMAAKLIGANPERIKHLTLCNNHAIGEITHELIGIDINDYKQKFKLPTSHIYLTKKFVFLYKKKKPYLKNKDKCVKCLSCLNNCPVKAISAGEKISFDYDKCIGCMVCIESCKYDALRYKTSIPTRIIRCAYDLICKITRIS